MNAIILAAGLGSRLKPLTKEVPKPLVKVNGLSLIERQIYLLKEAGICEIVIVIGYMSDKFKFLEKKYNVKLIYNNKYKEYNNIYSLYLAQDYLNNTYILEGDVYLTKNLFIENLKHSTYFAVKKEMYENEWVLKYDNKKRLEEIYIGYEKGAYVMSGISYWNIDDTKVIKDKLNKLIKNKNFKNLYWDDIVRKEVENFNINVEEVDFNCVYEIDTVEDLENVPY
ncbi:sugar phosphate nucleotidyltransferase [Clostridium sp.]|uniref:sugar phosphate nucleotidyltransferase n=1 Tax=Clostridium sp. TaxID=1506 RepID=UPI002E78DD97|nr:sugar phosphate nucleotidyltransferase [Clostridium sp.]MEE0567785.1 sugar phosphate nucleotidyltransferase [Clostridium sp.]